MSLGTLGRVTRAISLGTVGALAAAGLMVVPAAASEAEHDAAPETTLVVPAPDVSPSMSVLTESDEGTGEDAGADADADVVHDASPEGSEPAADEPAEEPGGDAGAELAADDVPTSATISGTVTDARTGDSIYNVYVAAGPQAGQPFAWGDSYTQNDGGYSFKVLGTLPSTMNVSFGFYSTSASAPWGYESQYWDNVDRSSSQGTPLEVAAGDTFTDIDAALMPQGAISGSVSTYVDNALEPVANEYVVLLDEDATSVLSVGVTDDSGLYEVAAPAGSYTVGFGYYSSSYGSDLPESGPETTTIDGYTIVQFYDLADSAEESTPVTIAAAEATTDINAIYGASPVDPRVIAGTVEIHGEAAVGEVLTSSIDGWSPSDVNLYPQWFSGDEQIPGARGDTYTVQADDIGRTIKLRVDGEKSGYTPATVISEPTAVVVDNDPGSLAIVLTNEDTTPVVDATVMVSHTTGSGISFTGTTGDDGRVLFESTPRGNYYVRAYPPEGAGIDEIATVSAGELTTEKYVISATGLPANVTLQPSQPSWQGGVSVLPGSVLEYSVTGDAGAESATWVLDEPWGTYNETGNLTESPAGTYSATITMPTTSGRFYLTATLVFDGVPTRIEVPVYIDPSGTILDQYGTPVAGATVTVSRADTEAGPYTVVPDGSIMLSPRNRTNPDTSGADGAFGWDTIPGWYKVTATKDGVTTETAGMEVPPERLDLLLGLDMGDAPEPTTAPMITGTVAVGSTLTATSGAWPMPDGEPAPISATAYQWTRDGAPISGATSATYVLTASDVGTKIAAQITLARSYDVSAGVGPESWVYTVASVSVPADGGDSGGDATNGNAALAVTGGGDMSGIAFVSALMLLAGVAIVVSRRRRGSVRS